MLIVWLPVISGLLTKFCIDQDNQLVALSQGFATGQASHVPDLAMSGHLVPYLSGLWAASSVMGILLVVRAAFWKRGPLKLCAVATCLNFLLILMPNRWRMQPHAPTKPVTIDRTSQPPNIEHRTREMITGCEWREKSAVSRRGGGGVGGGGRFADAVTWLPQASRASGCAGHRDESNCRSSWCRSTSGRWHRRDGFWSPRTSREHR